MTHINYEQSIRDIYLCKICNPIINILTPFAFGQEIKYVYDVENFLGTHTKSNLNVCDLCL